MSLPIRRLAVLALATGTLGLGAAAGIAPAASQSGMQAASSRPYMPIDSCDRALVRECSADARLKMTAVCEPFPGRLACADQVLTEKAQCLAAARCD